MKRKDFDPVVLNTASSVRWFDDFTEDGQPTNTYRFLSNFYVGDLFTLRGVTWSLWGWAGFNMPEVEFMTGEHAFQALKTLNSHEFHGIVTAKTPSEAKKRGRNCTLRPDWEEIKLDVMAAVVRSKFTLARREGQLLLLTGSALLTEGTFWNDEVWGVDLRAPGTPGRNWLGTLLMARRAELQAQKQYGVQNDTVSSNLGFVFGPTFGKA